MVSAEKARYDVLDKLREFARGRQSDVARGAETPELASLLVQKYGYGLCDAFHLIYGNVNGPTYRDVDDVVSSIHVDWRLTQAKRWKARPADLNLDNQGA